MVLFAFAWPWAIMSLLWTRLQCRKIPVWTMYGISIGTRSLFFILSCFFRQCEHLWNTHKQLCCWHWSTLCVHITQGPYSHILLTGEGGGWSKKYFWVWNFSQKGIFLSLWKTQGFLWLLPLRQVATMSSRCKSVMSVLNVHSTCEVLWDVMQTRHDWLGIFTALVQDYLSENFSREILF